MGFSKYYLQNPDAGFSYCFAFMNSAKVGGSL